MKPKSPIDLMIDAACGMPPEPTRRELTPAEKEACEQLSRDVLSDLRRYYPEVVKTRPTTWPIHLKHTIENMAVTMLRDLPPNDKDESRGGQRPPVGDSQAR